MVWIDCSHNSTVFVLVSMAQRFWLGVYGPEIATQCLWLRDCGSVSVVSYDSVSVVLYHSISAYDSGVLSPGLLHKQDDTALYEPFTTCFTWQNNLCELDHQYLVSSMEAVFNYVVQLVVLVVLVNGFTHMYCISYISFFCAAYTEKHVCSNFWSIIPNFFVWYWPEYLSNCDLSINQSWLY